MLPVLGFKHNHPVCDSSDNILPSVQQVSECFPKLGYHKRHLFLSTCSATVNAAKKLVPPDWFFVGKAFLKKISRMGDLE